MSKKILVGAVAACLWTLYVGGVAWAQTGNPDYESQVQHGLLVHGSRSTIIKENEQAESWDKDGTESLLIPALRRFFGKTTGVYLWNANEYPKYHGQPLVVEQVLRVFGDMPTGNFTTVSGYRVLASAKHGDTTYHVYVATYGDSTRIAAVGFVYNLCPPGGYTSKIGVTKGMHMRCEIDPTLTIFYPKNSSGGVTRIPEVDGAFIHQAQAYFGALHQRWSENGKHYHLTVNVRGIQGKSAD